MKVLRLTPLLDFGGVEKRLVNTAQHVDADLEFVFVALNSGGWAAEQIRLAGKRVIILGEEFRIPSLRLLLKLVGLIRKERPEVVHTSGAEANFHGVLAARLCGVPAVIAEEIGFPTHGIIGRLTFRFVYLFCDKLIAISEAVKERVIQLGELSADKIAVVYNPVSLPPASVRRRTAGERVRLLMVSRIEPVKNIAAVLEVLAKLRPRVPPFELTIVGDGSSLPGLRARCTELDLDSEVKFAGFQPEPTPFYERADVFLLPSLAEGLSNSLLEAMAHGLVCIATQVGGPRELIQDGETGYLIDPASREQLERALSNCMNMSDTERRTMGGRARAFTEDRFSLAGYVARLKLTYSRAAVGGWPSDRSSVARAGGSDLSV